MSSFPNDPFLVYKRKGDKSDPFLLYNEPKQVYGGKVVLTEIPDKGNHVTVKDSNNVSYAEVTSQASLSANNVYYVDYDRGIVYFDSSKEGLSFTFSYLGIGGSYVPATRVYTQSANGTVTQDVQDMINNYNQLNGTDLYNLFDPQTGHKHTGGAGDAPPIDSQYVTYDNGQGTVSKVKDTLDSHASQLADITKIRVNIDYYGAKPNDPTFDNAPIINQAINDLSTNYGGGIVEISGLYYFKPYINMKNNVILEGINATLKVMPTAGNYWSCVYLKNITNAIVRNITVDQNTNGNTNVNIDVTTTQNALAVFYINGSSNITIEKTTMHTYGVWAVIADSNNQNIYVRNNYIDYVQGPSTDSLSGTVKYDNTRIFVDAQTSIVENNTIISNDLNGNTAIEIHNEDGMALNNTIRNFRTGIILLTSLNSISDTNQSTLQARGNKIYGTIFGIEIWSVEQVGDTSNVIVSENQISVDAVKFTSPSGYGIGFSLSAVATNTKQFNNINILGNIITFVSDTTTYSDPNESFNFVGITVSAWNNINNCNVRNNIIISASGIGINIGGKESGTTWYFVDGADITGNLIIDAGKNTNISGSYRSAIALVGAYKNVNVGQNSIIDRSPSGTYYSKAVLEISQNGSNSRNITIQSIQGNNITPDYSYAISWTNATLQNGYTQNGSTPVSYTKDPFGFVHLRGSIKLASSGSNGNTAFALPAGYIPTNPIFKSNTLSVNASGLITSYAGANNIEYLDGIIFLANS